MLSPEKNHFIFHAGQPAEVRVAYEAATDVAVKDIDVVDL